MHLLVTRSRYRLLFAVIVSCVAATPVSGADAGSSDAGRGIRLSGGSIPELRPEVAFGESWALLIGINDYQHWPRLKTPLNDVRALEKLLVKRYGFSKGRMLTLLDEQATADGIYSAFSYLKQQMAPGDSLFIYYAGHGEWDAFDVGSWVPVEARRGSVADLIDTDRINRIVAGMGVRHVFLVADACYSGSLFRAGRPDITELAGDDYFLRNMGRVSRQALSSGGIEQVADSGYAGHSIFAYHFLNVLAANDEPYLSASALSARVEQLVVRDASQEPRWSRLAGTGDQDGEFFFIQENVRASLALMQRQRQQHWTAADIPNSPMDGVVGARQSAWKGGMNYVSVQGVGRAKMPRVWGNMDVRGAALIQAREVALENAANIFGETQAAGTSQEKTAAPIFIVEERVTDWRSMPEGGSDAMELQVTIDAIVGIAPAGFLRQDALSVELNQHQFRPGQHAQFTVTTSENLYLFIMNYTADGSLVQIFPNPHEPDNLLARGKRYRIPGPNAGYGIEVMPYDNVPSSKEQFIVLGLPADHELDGLIWGGPSAAGRNVDYAGFFDRLTTIPLDWMTQIIVPYTTREPSLSIPASANGKLLR